MACENDLLNAFRVTGIVLAYIGIEPCSISTTYEINTFLFIPILQKWSGKPKSYFSSGYRVYRPLTSVFYSVEVTVGFIH